MRGFALVMATCLVAWGSTAWAGPSEAPEQFAINPALPNLWVLKYEYSGGGLVVSTDGGKHWGLFCGDAYDGASRNTTYGLAVAGDGTIFIGTFDGLLVGRDQACAWASEPEFNGNWVADLHVDPLDPQRVFASTAIHGKVNGLWAYGAGEWSTFGSQAEGDGVRSFAVVRRGAEEGAAATAAGEEARRFYEVVFRFAELEPEDFITTVHVRYSDDDAETWVEYPYPLEGSFGDPRIVAVDPTNPERIVVHEQANSTNASDRVLINNAAGAPGEWQVLVDNDQLGGAVFDNEGTLYLGLRSGALWIQRPAAGQSAETLTLIAPGEEPNAVALGPRALGFDPAGDLLVGVLEDLGRVDTATGAFDSLVNLRALDSFHTCPGQDLVASCKDQLTVDGWCVESHYLEAPLCDVYSDGLASGAAGTGGTVENDGLSSQGSGGGSSGDASGGVAGQAGSGGEPSANHAGSRTGSDGSDGGGGCQVRLEGRRAGGLAGALLLGLGLLWRRQSRRTTSAMR